MSALADLAIDYVRPLLKGTRCCIQAGGCIGAWPVRFANVFDHVISFEPEPGNFSKLEEVTRSIDNVRVYNAALGNQSGLAHMEITAGESANANRGAYYMRPGGDIPVMIIDSFGLSPDLIYLDIEGAEYMALEGAAETIARSSPVIGVEDKGHHSRYGSQRIEQLLVDLYGYRSAGRPFNTDQVFIK